jgi:hypothetical protein
MVKAAKILLRYSAITILVIFSVLFLSTIAFSLILRYQLADEIAYSAKDHPELVKALEVGKKTPLSFDIHGCYKTDTGEQYNFAVNINQQHKIMEIRMIDEYGLNFFPPKAAASFSLDGSVMHFRNASGSQGLLSGAGWVLGRVDEIKEDYAFIAHSNIFTLILKRVEC